jgi:iron complex outermembrane recepter protein
MNKFIRFAVACGLLTSIARGQTLPSPNFLRAPHELKRLSLEDLLKVQVTSVSRRPESASHAAAAVEAIPQEQIERTGAASVQDALRLATGLQVSRFVGHSYAISSRGFTSVAANKLQVMQDGRSLYSPLFSGVFWDAYGAMMDDIDRIEVIRGPGATMWGANAVNGVINIITKDARDTQGGLVTAGGGTEERGFVAVRYGTKLSEKTFYRVYARYHDRDPLTLANGNDANTSPTEWQGGFRLDSQPVEQDHVTLQGDYLYNQSNAILGQDAFNRSGNVLARWTRRFNTGSDFQLQAYYDRFERNVPGQFGEDRDTFDLDAQYRTRVAERHDMVTGLNYRVSADETKTGGTTQFVPGEKTIQILSTFVQDEITIAPRQLAFVIGSKFEWDSLDGFEAQPSIRLAWTPTERQTVWAAWSRAVRMPSRIDEDLRLVPIPSSGIVAVSGNPDFAPEKLYAWEFGYRVQPHEKLFVDLAAFLNDYDELRSLEPTPPTGLPLVQRNRLDARTSGAELSFKYQVAPWWRLSGNYRYLHKELRPRPDSRDPNRGSLEGNDSPHLFSVWSSMDLPQRVTFDCILRRVAALPVPRVPQYLELDLRVAWRPAERWEIAAVGQNLFHGQHREFGAASPTAQEVERGFYGKVTWRF